MPTALKILNAIFILFALFMAYALSGYVMWVREKRVRSVLPEE